MRFFGERGDDIGFDLFQPGIEHDGSGLWIIEDQVVVEFCVHRPPSHEANAMR